MTRKRLVLALFSAAVVVVDGLHTAPRLAHSPPRHPSPRLVASVKGLLPTLLPDTPKAVDTAIAGVSLAGTITALGSLESQFGVPLYTPALMASGIIFFVGPAPPDPKGFLSGTLCSATLSAVTLFALSNFVPPVAADGLTTGVLLIWYKTVGTVYPPASVLAGALYSAAAASEVAGDIGAGASFLVCPWLAGHASLYAAASAVSRLRAAARVRLTRVQLIATEGGLTDEALLEIFDLYDTNTSGFLDASELKVALRKLLGTDLALEDCEEFVRSADRDGNGEIDFEEFCFVCRGQLER